MNKQTLRALKGSIKKWELIVAGKGKDLGDENCSLCKRFVYSRECMGCPVQQKTGRQFCEASPYKKWMLLTGGYGAVADTPERKKAARAELKFLKSLLP